MVGDPEVLMYQVLVPVENAVTTFSSVVPESTILLTPPEVSVSLQ